MCTLLSEKYSMEIVSYQEIFHSCVGLGEANQPQDPQPHNAYVNYHEKYFQLYQRKTTISEWTLAFVTPWRARKEPYSLLAPFWWWAAEDKIVGYYYARFRLQRTMMLDSRTLLFTGLNDYLKNNNYIVIIAVTDLTHFP